MGEDRIILSANERERLLSGSSISDPATLPANPAPSRQTSTPFKRNARQGDALAIRVFLVSPTRLLSAAPASGIRLGVEHFPLNAYYPAPRLTGIYVLRAYVYTPPSALCTPPPRLCTCAHPLSAVCFFLCVERVDNLGAYSIPPEAGLLISSDFVNVARCAGF